ncbi:Pentatricopeptide repeat-containing protein [Quillaja saponaria]|uniref:Pentatricopeptide repeat-containing protein n=1 Tax=Quillaja saponaria TaxID=32244 RepID=A0AAD7M3J9_QUISA|nr:Pentatricopeptide repeat-containing protein [Quillaja saponaria]
MVIIIYAKKLFGAIIYRNLYSCSTSDICNSSPVWEFFNKSPRRVKLHICDSYSKVHLALEQESQGRPRENVPYRKQAKHENTYEAVGSFCHKNSICTKPTKFILCTVLNSCAKTVNWQLGLQIHAYMVQSGHEENLFLSSALVDFYAKCDAIMDARKVFDEMKVRDQVSWTSFIVGLSQNRQRRDALSMFKEMLGSQIKPNCFTYVGVITASAGLKEAFELGLSLHSHVIKFGFNTNSFVVSSLIDCYAKWGSIGHAVLLFDEIHERDVILYNSMISGYSQNLCGKGALKLFMEMRNKNLSPTDYTFTSILNACGSLTVLFQGRQVHSLVIKMGSERNVFVNSALIDMYSKCGDVNGSCCIFDQTCEKNNVLWTSMITAYAQSGRGSDALKLFEHLLTEEGFVPDHICFTAVLTACNHAGLLDKGIEYFNKMRTTYGLFPDVDQCACLVDLFARNGELRKAKDLMEKMPYDPNYVMLSSFLSSCNIHGEVELGREAAKQLIQLNPCNDAPYLILAHIYARSGLWTEVAEVRKLIQQRGIRNHSGWSWVEVDRAVMSS